ncbi:MAG: hypothetical protein VXY93_16775, partial [Pseudomonadota bacterium]|nr:hypothetical protein [Pseudomonadota bacterium]
MGGDQVKFSRNGDVTIGHTVANKDIFIAGTKSSALDTIMVEVNAQSEQTCFQKIITIGRQGGNDTTQIGGGSGIGAFINLHHSNLSCNTSLRGNSNSWLNRGYGNLGIGTFSPTRKLTVHDGGGNNRVINVSSNNTNGAFIAFLDNNITSDTQTRIGGSGDCVLNLRGKTIQLETSS